MSRVLILNKSAASIKNSRMQRTSTTFRRGAFCTLNRKPSKERTFVAGSAQINLVSLAFMMIISTFACGAFYLYQVNSIATKGYEVRDLQNQIQDLQKDSKKMEIHEVELRSMYNIEKASKDLNLVNSDKVSYVELNGPVAMK